MDVDAILSPSPTSQSQLGELESPIRRGRTALYLNGNVPDTASATYLVESNAEEKSFGYHWSTSPLVGNPQLTDYYIAGYFTNVNTATMDLFPHATFMTWLKKEQKKTDEDKMVLYAMLSLATTFASRPDRASHRNVFISITHHLLQCDVSASPVQTIQALVLLSLAEFSRGNATIAFALGGQATRVACGMKYNIEEGIARVETPTYGMSPVMFAECKRRSFWAAHTVDLFGACTMGYPTSINKADIFLRLPCITHIYTNGMVSSAPYFEGDSGMSRWITAQDRSQIGPFGYLVQIATISHDIQATAIRQRNQTIAHGSLINGLRLTLQRLEFEERLKSWYEGYQASGNTGLQPGNSRRSTSSPGIAGIHILYHLAHMELSRHICHEQCTDQEVAEHVKKANYHAWKTLEMAQQLVSRGYTDIRDYGFALKSPLTGAAIFTAIDIVTAVGLTSDLLEHRSRLMRLVYGGIELLDGLAEIWDTARQQRRMVSDRMQRVVIKINESIADRKVGYFVPEPMGMSLGNKFDLIYGIDRMQYTRALDWGENIKIKDDMMEISVHERKIS